MAASARLLVSVKYTLPTSYEPIMMAHAGAVRSTRGVSPVPTPRSTAPSDPPRLHPSSSRLSLERTTEEASPAVVGDDPLQRREQAARALALVQLPPRLGDVERGRQRRCRLPHTNQHARTMAISRGVEDGRARADGRQRERAGGWAGVHTPPARAPA